MMSQVIKSFRVIASVRPFWSLGDFVTQTFDISALALPSCIEVTEALRERKLEAIRVTFIRERKRAENV